MMEYVSKKIETAKKGMIFTGAISLTLVLNVVIAWLVNNETMMLIELAFLIAVCIYSISQCNNLVNLIDIETELLLKEEVEDEEL